ncbi:hypothetical protein [uncultured Shewanella sp.]|uniref:hypothetical protein n=1 Tax=uncultured Shewanella sp. TaxID=173975 RepID=UPI00260999E3|nr:hypothetical protein [uncultured Shewanella sp.]
MVTVYLTAEEFLSLATFIKKTAKKLKHFKINNKYSNFLEKTLKVALKMKKIEPLHRGNHAYPSKERAT